ncbi:MAG: translation elongation factor Ts [Candidatus Binatia bacterium]
MSVTAAEVKQLRERTGAGMMDCKRALAEVGGDIDAAIVLLRERGLAGASKKGGRVTAEGLVGVFPAPDARSAVVVELNCETDFVAKTDDFSGLLQDLGEALLAAEGLEEGSADTVADLALANGEQVADRISAAIASIGENVSLRRFTKFTAPSGRLGHYVHAGGKIGVLVEVEGATDAHSEACRVLAMQVAAANPRFVDREQIDATEIEKERAIYKNEAAASGKPDKILDRIADGKMAKYFREVCLLEQEFIRDSDLDVAAFLEAQATEGSGSLVVKRFVRYQLGEGIERREADLAAEVAEQIAGSS